MKSSMFVTGIVFFCLVGWFYAGSAIGADEHAAPVEESGEVVTGLSSEDEPREPATDDVRHGSDLAPADGSETETEPGNQLFEAPPTEEASAEESAPTEDIAAEPAEETPVADESSDVTQVVAENDFGRIDLAIQDQDVVKVLQMLAIQSHRNILPSPSVSGNISAALYDVDFYEALNAILATNGYAYREEGNFIYIYTAAEMKEIEERDRKSVSEVVWLSYTPAEDVAKVIEPLLTPGRGTVIFSAAAAQGFVPTPSDGGGNSSALHDYVVVHDYPERVAEIRELIKQIDIKPPMVEIDATILEARLSEDNAWGVDLTILADFAMTEFTNPLSAITNLMSGAVGPSGTAAQTTVGNTTTGSSGVRVGIVTSDVAAFIRALDQVTDTTILAHPKIVTLNRQAAKLIAGEKLGYVSTTATETSTTQTIEFLEVGTKLSVRPFVSNDDFIRLELQPEISEGEVTSVGDFVIPNETTNELIANVRVPNGRTVVLGGLFKETTTVTRDQVPVLGDVPLLGAAFQGRDDEVRRAEVIFLIRPTIIKEPTMTAVGDKVMEDLRHARVGAREELLFWSRSKVAAAHLNKADELIAKGKNDEAQMEVNAALRLDPTLIEGQRMREQLTGKRLDVRDKSVLSAHLDQMIAEQLGQEVAPSGAAPVESETEAFTNAEPTDNLNNQ